MNWRVSPDPFPLEPDFAAELETLGRVLLQFYRAVNLLYRQSAAGKQPAWIAGWLDQGKPSALVELQRTPPSKTTSRASSARTFSWAKPAMASPNWTASPAASA